MEIKETITEQHRIRFNTYRFLYCLRPSVCRCTVNLIFSGLETANSKLKRSYVIIGRHSW